MKTGTDTGYGEPPQACPVCLNSVARERQECLSVLSRVVATVSACGAHSSLVPCEATWQLAMAFMLTERLYSLGMRLCLLLSVSIPQSFPSVHPAIQEELLK